MAGTDDSSAKICQMCGTDCTNKPRVKDAKGGYYCKACAEKMAPKSAPPTAPGSKSGAKGAASSGEPNILAKLVEQSLAEAEGSCPACRKKMKPGAVICTACGFSTVSGQMVQTAIQKPELIIDKTAKVKTRRKLRLDPSISILIALVVFGGLFGLSMVEPLFIPITFLITLIYQFCLMLAVTIYAFRDGESGWGIIGILSFFFWCAWLAMIYFIWFVTDREHLKSLWLISVVSCVVAIVMFVLQADEINKTLEEMKANQP